MPNQQLPYPEILEQAGFYHQGRPLGERVWSAEELQPAHWVSRAGVLSDEDVRSRREHIERAFRYQAMLRPEADQGRIGIPTFTSFRARPASISSVWTPISKPISSWPASSTGSAPRGTTGKHVLADYAESFAGVSNQFLSLRAFAELL